MSSIYIERARTKLLFFYLRIRGTKRAKGKQSIERRENKRSGKNLCVFSLYQVGLIFSLLKDTKSD